MFPFHLIFIDSSKFASLLSVVQIEIKITVTSDLDESIHKYSNQKPHVMASILPTFTISVSALVYIMCVCLNLIDFNLICPYTRDMFPFIYSL